MPAAAGIARAALFSAAATLSAGTLLVCAWLASGLLPVLQGAQAFTWSISHASLAVLATLIAAPPALWLTAQPGTPHLRVAAAFALSSWSLGFLHALDLLVFTVPALGTEGRNLALLALLNFLGAVVPVANIAATGLLMLSRFLALETHALRDLGFRPIQKRFSLALKLTAPGIVLPAGLMPLLNYALALRLLYYASMLGLLLSFLALLPLFLLRAKRAAALLARAAAKAPAGASPWVRRAKAALRAELRCLLAVTGSTGTHLLLEVLRGVPMGLSGQGSAALNLLVRLSEILDLAVNGYMALSMTGALSMQGSKQRLRLAQQRRQRWQRAKEQRHAGEAMEAWDEKVRELACRGVSLSALLRFYEQLPSHMPHWDSSVHSTADVVRQAIIPLTEPGKCAAAELLMHGSPAVPAKMVTHAWSNLFRDLLAAIVADALGEGEFKAFALLMDSDMACLEDWVQQAGVGAKAYWICAFCVNQHASICHRNHQRTDPVTGANCPECSCGYTKCLNDTAPLLQDGRSVPCEMNKFNDMIKYLSMDNAGFSQVVPIDAKFHTFKRAWCIAELATANEVGMVQTIKIRSAEDLEAHEAELHGLRIQDMQASRPEDKELILASIPDHDRFNEFVQHMIFEDLLPSWSHLDALERMAVAGCVLRWHQTPVWGAEKETDVVV